ncbi:MAG: hypothetical protein P9M08_05740 [Candidatus Erginobacter occultus]|nr:hypothetical protein [Candidatus Erginobacter occultus]
MLYTKPGITKQIMFSCNNKPAENDGVLVLFSGGMDSIAAAVLLSRKFATVRLLTCHCPYIFGCRACTAARVRDIKAALPETVISQTIEDTFNSFRRIGPLKAAIGARSSLLVCTVCKMAMHLKAIEVCRRERLSYASSGIGVREQQTFPDQLPGLEERVNQLYADAGIDWLSPLETYTKKQVKELLVPLGLFPKVRIPRCLIKYFQELWWFYFGFPKDERILDWYDSALPLLKQAAEDSGV